MNALPKVGDKATSSKIYTTADVVAFAEVSGDKNPVHLDADFAAASIFKMPIVHGMFVAAQISELAAGKLPGPGSVYLHQELNFKAPVYHNETIICEIEVLNIKEEKRIVELSTFCINEEGKKVIEGIAIIKLL